MRDKSAGWEHHLKGPDRGRGAGNSSKSGGTAAPRVAAGPASGQMLLLSLGFSMREESCKTSKLPVKQKHLGGLFSPRPHPGQPPDAPPPTLHFKPFSRRIISCDLLLFVWIIFDNVTHGFHYHLYCWMQPLPVSDLMKPTNHRHLTNLGGVSLSCFGSAMGERQGKASTDAPLGELRHSGDFRCWIFMSFIFWQALAPLCLRRKEK